MAGWWVAASDTDEINQDIDDSTLIFLPAHVVVFFPSSPILKRPATSTFQDVQYVEIYCYAEELLAGERL